jgi:hypothetical protein
MMADQGSGIRQKIRAQGEPAIATQGEGGSTGRQSEMYVIIGSLCRKAAKWSAITLGGLIALVAVLGTIAETTTTPEEKARWAQERAARDQQWSEAELKARAAEYGVRYESDWGNSYRITASEMGDKWPFVHDTATVFCKMTDYGRPMVTISFNDGSTIYGLNGVARGKEKMLGTDDVQRRHPEYGTFTGDVSSLIRRAIANCAT